MNSLKVLWNTLTKAVSLYLATGTLAYIFGRLLASLPPSTEISASGATAFEGIFSVIQSPLYYILFATILFVGWPLALREIDCKGAPQSNSAKLQRWTAKVLCHLGRPVFGLVIPPFCILIGIKAVWRIQADPGFSDLNVILAIVAFFGIFSQVLAEWLQLQDEQKANSVLHQNYLEQP